MRKPAWDSSIFGFCGAQSLYRFANGYGASVCITGFICEGNEKVWELAVIKYTGDTIDSYELDYDADITDGVIGYLDYEEVEKLLDRIEAL